MRLVTAIGAAMVGAALQAQTDEPAAEVVIRGIAVFDVEAERLLTARDIVVRGTHVERITPTGGPLPRAKTLIEGRGKVAIPGLIDTPVRVAGFTGNDAQGLLAAGITAIHDIGTPPGQRLRWRQDLDSGRLWAPRLVDGCGPGGPAPASSAAPRAADALHDDLARLVSSQGRTPAQALRAFTFDRARQLCLDHLGAISAGGPADLVVLSANPLDDIRHSRAIDAVVFRGGVLTQAHLRMLRRHALPTPTPAR
jgi:adenine deaminase